MRLAFFGVHGVMRAVASAGRTLPDEIIIGRAEFCVSMQYFELIVCTQEGANHRVRKVRKILNFYALQPFKLDLR